MLKPKLFFAGLLFLVQISLAQTGKQYSFTHYTNETGLISNQVNAIVQDQEGYIWLGTTEGLQRFDGTRYKTFRNEKNNPRSLPSSLVQQLIKDKKDNIWVVTGDFHVGIFNTKTFSFREANIKPTDPNGPYTTKKLYVDEHGNVFLQLQGLEVLTYNAARNEFSRDEKVFSIPQELHVIEFAQQPGTKKYWIGLYPEGLAIYDAANKSLSYPGRNVAKEKAVDRLSKSGGVIRCKFDSKGRFWYVTWGGGYPIVHCYDPSSDSILLKEEFVSRLKSYNEVYGFLEQKDGTIWTNGLGVLAKFQDKENSFQLVFNGYLNEHSIYFDAINELYEDGKQNIWVATRNNGLYRFNPSKEYFSNTGHINRINNKGGNGAIMSFIKTKWGTLLTGSWGDGIYHYNKDLELIPTNIKGIDNKLGPIVWNMSYSGDSNRIWWAAQPGFYAIDQEKRAATYYNPPILEGRTIRQMAEDRLGNLWFGMQRMGVFKWTAMNGSLKENTGYAKVTTVPTTQINKINIDSKGLIWIGTAADGLYVLEPSTNKELLHFGTKLNGENKIAEDAITSILEYNDSLVVFSTSRFIYIYNRKKNLLANLEPQEPLSGYITSSERDRNGYLWVSTTSGLYRVNMQRKVFVKFSRNDGIDNDNFLLAASMSLPDGRMLFGTSNHFITFEPSRIRLNNVVSNVIITDFKVMNRPLQVDSLFKLNKVELTHDNNSLDIQFSSLSFNGDYPILYKLEGLDKEWKVADESRQAIYSYLPPGTYTFLVRPIDSEGNESGNITRLLIEVNPPFWNSWWFYSLLALMVILLLYWMDKERMKRKDAILKMRTDIARNLHRDINNALSNINILSEMARIKADKDINKSKEYIEQIHSKSHNMIIAMDDMLWSIDPANDNMSKTIARMKEYIAALNSRSDAEIEMLVDKNVEKLELNMKLRHESFLLFKDGIKKLVDSGAKKCKVHIGIDKSIMQFTLQFDNYCCNMQQLNNLLQSRDMEQRMKSIFADMKVQVHKSNSIIFLKVPVN